MSIEQLNGFSQILTTFNFQQEEASFKENDNNTELLPAQEDSIQLSLQAQKALNQKQADASQNATEIVPQPEAFFQIDAQGNRVQISPEGTELAASQTSKVAWETSSVEASKNVVGTATLDSGTKVSIYTTDFAEGEEKPFFDAPDKKVMAEITRTDGSTETLAIRANTVISEDADGNLVVNSGPEKYKTSERFEINGTSRNDVIINLNGASNIDCGEGNDTIISFNRVDNIYLGDGNNTFISPTAGGISRIEAGDGNNKVTANTIKEIYFGNGNNTITSHNVDKIEAGDGENIIYLNKGSRIQLGNGDNNINISVKDNEYNHSYLMLGNGNNNIAFSGQYNFAKNLQIGDGNNNIKVDGFIINSDIGNGNNTISIGKAFDFSTMDRMTGSISHSADSISSRLKWSSINNDLHEANMKIGDGNNKFDFAVSYGNIEIGNGDNIFTTDSSIQISNLTFGDGNNLFTSNFLGIDNLTFGNGNNKIDTDKSYMTHINFGNGNNIIESDESYITQIHTGDGNNWFTFGDMEGCLISTGKGDDTVYITGNIYGSISMQTYINLGAGDDAFKVDGSVQGLMFFGGDGNDTVEIKGNVIDSQIDTGFGGANTEPYLERVTIYKNVFNSFITSNSPLSEISIYGEMIDSTLNNEKYKNTMRKSEQQSLRQLAEQELAEQRANSFTWLVPNN